MKGLDERKLRRRIRQLEQVLDLERQFNWTDGGMSLYEREQDGWAALPRGLVADGYEDRRLIDEVLLRQAPQLVGFLFEEAALERRELE